MIRLSTIGDLLAYGTGLNGYCRVCKKGRQVDVHALAEKYGREASYIKGETPIKLRCKDCGARGDYQLASPGR